MAHIEEYTDEDLAAMLNRHSLWVMAAAALIFCVVLAVTRG